MNLFQTVRPIIFLADAGIPMIFISLPAMVIALFPVIVIEALILKKRLKLSSADAFKASGYANVVSTIVGIPLAWIAAFPVEMLFGSVAFSMPSMGKMALNARVEDVIATIMTAPWISGEGGSWTVPLAQAVLLVPFFFASVWIERRLVKTTLLLCAVDQASVKRAVWVANLASYAGLMVIALGMMTWLAVLEWRSPGLFTKQVESRLSSGATTIDATQFGNSTWDRLFIFDPYTPKRKVCDSLKLAPRKCSVPKLGKQVAENEFFIVFMEGQEVSETDRFPRKIANFDRSCTFKEIPRGNVRFATERNPGWWLKCD